MSQEEDDVDNVLLSTSTLLKSQDTFRGKINTNSSLYKSLNSNNNNNNNNNNSNFNFNQSINNNKAIFLDNKEFNSLSKDIEEYLNSIENKNSDDDDDEQNSTVNEINNDLPITFLCDANEAIKKQQLYIQQLERQLKQDKRIGDNLLQQSLELSSTEKELSELKVKFNDIERTNKFLLTKTAEARLDLENSEKINQTKIANKNLEIEGLSKKIKFLSNSEKELEDKLKEMDNKYLELERNTQLKIRAIEKEKTNCRTEIVELKHKNSNQNDLTSIQKLKDSEIQHLKSINKKLEEQINHQKQTLDSTLKQLSEKDKQLDTFKNIITSPPSSSSSSSSSLSASLKNSEIETLNQSLKSEINYFKKINKEQKDEINRLNKIFEGVGNLEMIKQQNENMKEKIKRLEPLIEKYNRLQVEHNQLINEKNQMELSFGSIDKQQSTQQLQQKIIQLENDNQTLIGKIGEITANWKLMESRNQDYSIRIQQEKDSLNEKLTKINELTEKIKRLEKLNYLLNRERDNIKNILDTYDDNQQPQDNNNNDDNNNNNNESNDTKRRIEIINELERSLKEKNILIQEYEYKLDCNNNNSNNVNGDFSSINYKEECKRLNKEIEKLLQENALLEARLGKGEFDPLKTKVLHFSNNPSSLILNQQQQQEESNNNNNINNNDKNNNNNNNSIQIDKKLIEENHRLLIQINDGEKKMDRLKQIFKQKINEFREAVYALLGFKIDVDTNNRYKLQSMYAERESDFLMFQQSPPTQQSNNKGRIQMELLETEFTRNLDKEIKAYLFACKSIPSFLSQVTIELFSKQTFHP
ncbi:hypothetical protein ACTFIW_002394 [Dictyostelium discoideum]